MNIYEICFSPTGGTQRVSRVLTEGLGHESTFIDLCDRAVESQSIALTEQDLAVIAVPSYSGRVPATAVQRLARIQAHGAKAVLVAVYGNRAYEDTLVELQDVASQAGFVVVGAVAAIAEHSIARQYAKGRPDAEDVLQLKDFSRKIMVKLSKGDRSLPSIPGNRPYRKTGNAGVVPVTLADRCVKCGLCAAKCPVGAIDKDDPAKVDKDQCISCMRCVAVCPHKAKEVNEALLSMVSSMLQKVCSVRKKCELYL